MERTFVMLKAGTLQRRLVGELINRFERKGLKIIALKAMRIDRALAEKHYQEHAGKGFYEELINYSISSPVVAMVMEGNEAIPMVRRLVGATKIEESQPGSIRGDYAHSTTMNIVHASDSPESAAREIALFFKDGEILSWDDGNAAWL